VWPAVPPGTGLEGVLGLGGRRRRECAHAVAEARDAANGSAEHANPEGDGRNGGEAMQTGDHGDQLKAPKPRTRSTSSEDLLSAYSTRPNQRIEPAIPANIASSAPPAKRLVTSCLRFSVASFDPSRS
jgi:hypothetical protein